jgi:Leucine rich repeat
LVVVDATEPLICNGLDTCTYSNIFGLKNDRELEFDIPESTFTKIIIEDSTIKELPQNLLRTFPDLTSVEAQNVGLENIHSESFDCGANKTSVLLNINLAHNRLENIFKSVLVTAPSLETLNLSHNLIETIKPQALSDSVKLIALDLSHNKLRFLGQKCFETLKILKVLNISHNLITLFEAETFDTIRKLQNLDLSHNQLKKCPDVCPLTSMDTLDLSYNSGMDFKTNQCWPERLYKLSLDGIGIEELSMPNVTNLHFLSIQDNQMIRFGFRNISSFLPLLRTLKIANNAWECSYLKLMLAKLKDQKIRIFDINPGESGPNMVEGIGCVLFKSNTNQTSHWFNIVSAVMVSAFIAIIGFMIIKYARRRRVTVIENVYYSTNNDSTSSEVEVNVVDAGYVDPVDILEQADAESVGYAEPYEISEDDAGYSTLEVKEY